MHSSPWVVVSLVAAMAGSGVVAAAAENTSLFFEGDMVRGGSAAGVTGPACVLASQFKRRELIVWRIRVRDANGQNVDAGALAAVEEGQHALRQPWCVEQHHNDKRRQRHLAFGKSPQSERQRRLGRTGSNLDRAHSRTRGLSRV